MYPMKFPVAFVIDKLCIEEHTPVQTGQLVRLNRCPSSAEVPNQPLLTEGHSRMVKSPTLSRRLVTEHEHIGCELGLGDMRKSNIVICFGYIAIYNTGQASEQPNLFSYLLQFKWFKSNE